MSVRRPLLLPLVPLYAAGLRLKNRRFDGHTTIEHQLRDPVINVGSLSAGGAGKTPFLIVLAKLVREIGYAPDVLSRGYGRRSRGVLRVDPNGTAQMFGDEPLMLAQVLGCPVYVGEDRYLAGRAAEADGTDSGRGLHLLDDGFSHRRLARTVDIVLLTARELHDTLLPAGNLREPLLSMRRADIVVVRASEESKVRPALDRIFSGSERRPVWTIERRLTVPAAMPAKPFVFCGIARPADFEKMLRERGASPAGTRFFRDHHPYTSASVDALLRDAKSSGADGFLTTTKDAVKLDTGMRAKLQAIGPLAVADALVGLHDRDACAEDLKRLLRARTKLGTFVVGPERDQ